MKTSFSQKEFYCKCKGFVLLLWQLTLDPKDPKVWLSLLYKMLYSGYIQQYTATFYYTHNICVISYPTEYSIETVICRFLSSTMRCLK